MEVETQTVAPPPKAGAAAAAGVVSAELAVVAPPRQLPERLLAWVDRHRLKLLAFVLLIYLLGFNGQWRLHPDSALYLTIGRNIAEGNGYTYHGSPHHLAYPGLPWLFAATFKLFGTGNLVAPHVVLLLSALATLALVYRLFLLHSGRPMAVLMTVAVGLSRTFYRHSYELLADMPFLLGVTAFLVGYESVFYRRYDKDVRESIPSPRGKPHWGDYLLLVGGLALAMVMRPTMLALLLAIVLTVVLSLFRRPVRKGRLLAGAAVVVFAAAAAVAFFSLDPRRSAGSEEKGDEYVEAFFDAVTTGAGGVVRKAAGTNLPALLHPAASEAVFGIDFGHLDVGRWYVPVSALPSLLSVAASLFLFRRRLLWGVWASVTVVMMLATVVEVRYFLQVLPLLLYGWWLALVWLNRRLSRAGWGPWADWVPLALGVLLFGLNVLRVGSVVVEQRSAAAGAYYRNGKYAGMPAIADHLREYTPEGSWVLVPRKYGRILTYLSRRNAVEPSPVTRLDPDEQPVFVLDPMDDEGRRWMAELRIAPGEPVGPALPDRRGKSWQLHRADKL